VRAALSRMAATSISFVLCLVYLLIFPFHVWGMAVQRQLFLRIDDKYFSPPCCLI
jgi:hypothetical protein